MSNTLVLKPINNLLQEKFFVPSYQRGYRWTDKEVVALLDDIYQFYKDSVDAKSETYYCLQPVVVTQNDDEWVLVDGQQRITTILLILTYLDDLMAILGKKKYKIRYDTRPKSADFISKIKSVEEEEAYEYIDFYYIWKAYAAIEKWFKDKDGNTKLSILDTITKEIKNVKVIWYEVESKEAIEIFTRINMGKIPLTNAELVKALFLRTSNFSKENNELIELRQIEIATEWDRIENKLQQESFWYFIYDNEQHYDTKIEFIFDLMKNKNQNSDDLYTFLAFNNDFEQGRFITEIWLEVKEYFMRLEEWYANDKFYHLIGYLIQTGTKISEILEDTREMSKKELELYLREKIKKSFKGVEIREIGYGDKHIKNILLLFNIESILQNPKSNIRFPFDEFKKKKWDIEHISSIQSDMPSDKYRQKWLENIIDFFEGETVLDHFEKSDAKVNELVIEIKNTIIAEKYDDVSFSSLYEQILTYFKEKDSNRDNFVNKLSNLTLLDEHTNRSYQNAVFPVKRKRILRNDKNGIFVPLCTKNVFLKYYSEKLHEVMFWQESDAKSYLNNIESTLKCYFE